MNDNLRLYESYKALNESVINMMKDATKRLRCNLRCISNLDTKSGDYGEMLIYYYDISKAVFEFVTEVSKYGIYNYIDYFTYRLYRDELDDVWYTIRFKYKLLIQEANNNND